MVTLSWGDGLAGCCCEPCPSSGVVRVMTLWLCMEVLHMACSVASLQTWFARVEDSCQHLSACVALWSSLMLLFHFSWHVLNSNVLSFVFAASCFERRQDPTRRLMVGLVGYPNVGKSSTINAIFGSKKTAVAPTPGKTKHFQTLNVTPTVCLCDCPGKAMWAWNMMGPASAACRPWLSVLGICTDCITVWGMHSKLASISLPSPGLCV